MPFVRVAMLPSLLTLGNFTCGFVAIVLSLNAVRDHMRAEAMIVRESISAVPAQANAGAASADASPARTEASRSADKWRDSAGRFLLYACLLVFLGMIFDTLDGRVARLTGTESRFGAELDSLADVCTFGLAPAVLVATNWILALPDGKSWWGQVLFFSAGYAACAALRLARYNVETGPGDRNFFHGLPSPGAAGCLVSTSLLLRSTSFHEEWWIRLAAWTGERMNPDEAQARVLACYALFIGFLMVTRVAFIHVPNRFLSGHRHFTSLVLTVFAVVALVLQPFWVLALSFNGYAVWCLLAHGWRRFARRRPRAPLAENSAKQGTPP